MKTPAFGLPALVFATLLLLPGSSQAQYMYLDSNGDGVHSSADVLHGTGPTVVDIWLDTAHNRDGSTTHCSAGTTQPLSMFSYEVTLEATDGTAVFSSFTNRLIQFAHVVGGRSDGSHFYTGAYSTTPGIVKAPGRYLLGTFNVNVDGGTPSIRMVPTWPGSPSEFTEFGSECDGTQFPNSMMFETDWFDADGLAFEAGGGGNQTPSLAPLADMNVLAGEHASQSLSATDADHQPLTFAKASGPSFLFVQTLDVGAGTASGEIRLAPRAGDIGTYAANVSASDGTAADQVSFNITVSPSPNHPPVILQSPTVNVIAGHVANRFLRAGDPDGDLLHFAMVSGPAYAQLSDLLSRPGSVSAVLRTAPTLCDVGTASARISVSDGAAQSTADVSIRVFPPSAAPSSPLRTTPNSGDIWASRVGDMNGDGIPDVVSTYEGVARVTVFLAAGDGNLMPGVSYEISGSSYDVALGDVDRNGTLDVAVPDLTGHVNVLLGRGDGTLLPAVQYSIGNDVEAIAVSDLNGDGILDLVSANQAEGTVSVLTGVGDGTFRPKRDSSAGVRPRFIAVSDFNLDGRPDLAVTLIAGRSEPALLFLPGLGDGTFGAPIPGPFTGFAISVISGDWNVDGKPDLALSDLRNHTFQTFAGQGDGTFASPVSFWSSPEPYGLASDDLNGDGIADLVAGDIGDSTRVFFGNGAGGFPRRTSFAGLPAQYVALGDLNQDGLPDIVSGSFGALYVRLNTFASGNTAVEARAFVPKEQKPIFAGSDRDAIEIRLEPVHESYANEQVDLSSMTLSSEGTGSVSQIHSIVPMSVIATDTDRNGIAEIGITFTRSDVEALFGRIGRTEMVTAELRGSILGGRTFCAGVALNVKNVGPPHAVVFAPNPLNPRSKLTFATTRAGAARAQLFDLQGRLVRTLLDVAVLEAGPHEVVFDGKSSRGQPVSSGVLFYRLTSTEGTFEGRIVVLK